MLEVVLEQEKRDRQAGRPYQADHCKEVADRLIARATVLVAEACQRGETARVQLRQLDTSMRVSQSAARKMHRSQGCGIDVASDS